MTKKKHLIAAVEDENPVTNTANAENPAVAPRLICTIRFDNGGSYEGEYKMNAEGRPIRHGIGRYTTGEGVIFAGQWCDNAMAGKTCYVKIPSANVEYKGEMVNSEYHGIGEYACPQYYYNGEFARGKICGPGMLYDTLGRPCIAREKSDGVVRFQMDFIANSEDGDGLPQEILMSDLPGIPPSMQPLNHVSLSANSKNN